MITRTQACGQHRSLCVRPRTQRMLRVSATKAQPRSRGTPVVSGLLAFVGILSVSALHHETEITAIIGSFGASAVLLYDAIGSPLAQPRNVVGGHCVGALVGVTVYKAFGETQPLLACAVAVAFAIMLMDITVTLHPPAGATALIAVLGPAPIHDLGYMYVLSPVMLGATIMTCVAVLGNNLVGQRRYPKRYW